MCGAVVVVVVDVLVVCVAVEPPPLPPHPATATLLAKTARSVSMAASGVLFVGRAPGVIRGLGRPPYQASAASIAVGRASMSAQATASPGVSEAPPVQSTPASRSRWLLVVCCVAQFMVILDLSIVNVALPHIQDGLNISSADLVWVVDTYAIVFASFLMLAGRMADQLGQRRVFVAALILFGATSAFAGAAQSGLWLFVARGVRDSAVRSWPRRRWPSSPQPSHPAPGSTGQSPCGPR